MANLGKELTILTGHVDITYMYTQRVGHDLATEQQQCENTVRSAEIKGENHTRRENAYPLSGLFFPF